jgi:hypothetical protein
MEGCRQQRNEKLHVTHRDAVVHRDGTTPAE